MEANHMVAALLLGALVFLILVHRTFRGAIVTIGE